MIEINGKVYRNLQEQVEKNKDDIAQLQQEHPTPENVYTKTESDARYYTKTDADNLFTTREQVEGIISTKTYTKAEADDRFLPNVLDAEDYETAIYYDTNNYNRPTLFASNDEGSHPTTSKVQVDDSYIYMHSDSYNHGDDDVTYTGSLNISPSGVTAGFYDTRTGQDEQYVLTERRVKHDMLIYINDSYEHAGVVHMIFFDNYPLPYDLAKINRDFRGYIYPEMYYRVCDSSTFDNVRGDRVYVSFYLDNDELWFEEQDDFYISAGQYTEESANSYKVIACNDKIITF